jgi:putative transposase
MVKSLKYRLYPTKKQQRLLQENLNECRWLYNHFLEERKNSWEQEKKGIGYFQQCKSLIALKEERPSLNNVYSQVLQNVADRVDKSFQGFFRRVKAGDKKVGYPRFKGFDRFDSLTYKQAGFGWKIEDNRLTLSKIGSIKIKIHRSIIGTLKTCTIRKQANKWYACFSIEYQNNPLPESKKAVGIDVGLESFATFSTQEKINNPRFFKSDEKALAKAQRRLSKQTKGTPERNKVKKIVAHIHERISNRRHNFIHQEARKIVNKFGVICIEKLAVNDMMSKQTKVFGNKLNKSIADVAWGQFANVLSHKAAEAGRQFIAVNPKGTSQRCSQCGTIVKKDLSARWHDCPICGCHLNRDHNASLNILSLGLKTLGLVPRSPSIY